LGLGQQVQEALQAVYKSVDDVDAIVGMLAEDNRPPGFAISETALRVFVVTASRRLLCDRCVSRRHVEFGSA
jgi:Animal haem peroxidase